MFVIWSGNVYLNNFLPTLVRVFRAPFRCEFNAYLSISYFSFIRVCLLHNFQSFVLFCFMGSPKAQWMIYQFWLAILIFEDSLAEKNSWFSPIWRSTHGSTLHKTYFMMLFVIFWFCMCWSHVIFRFKLQFLTKREFTIFNAVILENMKPNQKT